MGQRAQLVELARLVGQAIPEPKVIQVQPAIQDQPEGPGTQVEQVPQAQLEPPGILEQLEQLEHLEQLEVRGPPGLQGE